VWKSGFDYADIVKCDGEFFLGIVGMAFFRNCVDLKYNRQSQEGVLGLMIGIRNP
jgi:hypothetical protein